MATGVATTMIATSTSMMSAHSFTVPMRPAKLPRAGMEPRAPLSAGPLPVIDAFDPSLADGIGADYTLAGRAK